MSLYPSIGNVQASPAINTTLILKNDGDESTPLINNNSVQEPISKDASAKKKGRMTRCVQFFFDDSGDSYVDSLLSCSFMYRALKFFPALLITFGIEMGNSAVLGHNQEVLTKHFTLVLFIPVISAIAGNIGLQTSSSVTAYINLRLVEGRPVRVKYLLGKYFSHCVVQIIVLATMMGLIASFCYRDPCQYAYGIIIFCGAFVNMGIAAIAGVWTPILLNKFGYDPSSGAGPFETALQDVVGACFFVWFAKLVLTAPWPPHCTLS